MDKKGLSTLISLASRDGNVHEKEANIIFMIGKANKIPKEEIEEMLKRPDGNTDFSLLTEESRFEYLYHLIQIMKADGQVSRSEVTHCESLAEKLGYNKKVVGELSRMIFGDPNITSDRSLIQARARKHLKK